MFLLEKFKKKPLVGLHVYPNEVRLLQLSRLKQGAAEKYAVADLAVGVITEGRIVDAKKLKTVITKLVEKTKTRGCDVAIALPNAQVMTKRITLEDELLDDESELEMTTNLQHYLPGMSDELSVDYVRLKENEFLIAAVRQDLLREYVHVVNQSGLKVKIVDVDSMALVRALNLVRTSSPIMLLDAYDFVSQLLVLQDQEIIFFQNLVGKELILELRRVMQLFFSTFRQIEIETIVLMGNYQFAPELKNFLSTECKLKMTELNPLQRLDLPAELSTRMLVAYGLAMRSVPQW